MNINIFQDFAKWSPVVLSGVVAVEQQFASEAPGTSKKQIVLDLVIAAAKIGEQVPVPSVQLISSLIDSTVAALNASGLFKHGSGSVPAPAPAV